VSEYSQAYPGHDVVTKPGRPDIAKAGVPSRIATDRTPVDGTLPNLDRTLEQVNKTMQQMQASLATMGPSPADSEERLNKVEKAVKWFSPWKALLGLIAFLVVGGVGVFTSLRDYAENAVVETVKAAHADVDNPVEPSVQTVEAMKSDLNKTAEGVQTLLNDRERQKAIKVVEVELDLHQQQYQGLIQEWTAKKAARRNAGDKPTKTPEHIKLEAHYKGLLEGS